MLKGYSLSGTVSEDLPRAYLKAMSNGGAASRARMIERERAEYILVNSLSKNA